jgi:hypothetical protein
VKSDWLTTKSKVLVASSWNSLCPIERTMHPALATRESWKILEQVVDKLLPRTWAYHPQVLDAYFKTKFKY